MTGDRAEPAAAALEITPLWQAREHLPVLACWLWQEFGREQGYALSETEGWLSDIARSDQRQTGVVESRKDLSPWLSSLFVAQASRRRGIGSRLVREIEQAAIERAVPNLYLYTFNQSRFYAGLGWSLIEIFSTAKGDAALMCKSFIEQGRG